MIILKSGVLLRLLEDMKLSQNEPEDRKPVLLQIRSIVPVLEEGELWPNKFYLKVSDESHAMYVSLPQEHNEMILSNKLLLGQFIYVHNLEAAHPAPVLRGVTPVPGRRPCCGTPEEIVPVADLLRFIGEVSDTESIMEKGVISEKKISELSDLESIAGSTDCENRRRVRSLSASKARPGESRKDLKCIPKRGGSVDNDSDSDSPKSTVSSMSMGLSKRRSWTEMEIMGVRQIFDSSAAKHDTRPARRCHSARASPVRPFRYDSSDDNLSLRGRKRDPGLAQKSVRSSKPCKTTASRKICEVPSYPAAKSCPINDRKVAAIAVLWDSLPSSLAKLGKEVMWQRDDAILAAVQALQEACAAERLIKCLGTYSAFPTGTGHDLQPCINKFFDLQDDLAHSRQIVQSLTNISPVRTTSDTTTSTCSVKDALNLALERKKNATSWIISAVANDICPVSNFLKSTTTTGVKKLSTASSTKPTNGACIIKKKLQQIRDDDDDHQQESPRGGMLYEAADMAHCLHEECEKWFLSNVEEFLSELERKSTYMESDNQIAGMMYQIKRVNDWLDSAMGKYGGQEGEYEVEVAAVCGRARNKIYGLLLKHVERTAMAPEM